MSETDFAVEESWDCKMAVEGSASKRLEAKVLATTNVQTQPHTPSSFVTLFRINVTHGDDTIEVLRRYSEFNDTHLRLAHALSNPHLLPELPPKLLINSDTHIAERLLELDAYLRSLIAVPTLADNQILHDFLGVPTEQATAKCSVRTFEYDSSQSEGNRYIRNSDL